MPFVGDEASPTTHQNRLMVTPQRYKIRMLDQTFKMMQGYTDTYAQKRQHWLDLDGQVPIFKNDNRPRDHYLYFQFCVAILFQSQEYIHRCNDKDYINFLRDHLRKNF